MEEHNEQAVPLETGVFSTCRTVEDAIRKAERLKPLNYIFYIQDNPSSLGILLSITGSQLPQKDVAQIFIQPSAIDDLYGGSVQEMLHSTLQPQTPPTLYEVLQYPTVLAETQTSILNLLELKKRVTLVLDENFGDGFESTDKNKIHDGSTFLNGIIKALAPENPDQQNETVGPNLFVIPWSKNQSSLESLGIHKAARLLLQDRYLYMRNGDSPMSAFENIQLALSMK